MGTVLIVEDSRTFSAMLSRRITGELGFEVRLAGSLAQAVELLGSGEDFFAALLDINLPDAPKGEVVDLVLEHGIPSIIFTGELDDELRERFWAKHIVDYVLKQNMENVQYMLSLVARLHRNPGIKVLVVDDSRTTRDMLGTLLRTHRYQVLEAETGEAALAVVAEHPDVRLAICDYNMPGMDGFELTRQLRHSHPKDRLAIIGLSGMSGLSLTARFLKSGANDYLSKPFLTEEFYTRVTQNIEMIEQIEQIRELANKDHLTRLYNRRYFFTAGAQLLALLARRRQPATVAMLDIDHFKKVNDALGHEAGDAVLRQMAQVLTSRFRESDIVARLGGEEFCVLAPDLDAEQAWQVFEALRVAFEATPAVFDGTPLRYTVSIGLCSAQGCSLEEMLRQADQMLYRSKSAGRNRVTGCGPGA
ncbi:MAG: diguanylate cyclase [Desulfovibrio sp.]